MMDETLYILQLPFGLEWVIKPWKIIGLTGAFLFSARWLVQLWVSKRTGKPELPRMFWYLSIAGCLMTLSYFTFGKTDSVGIIQNLFPMFIAGYNLFLDLSHSRRNRDQSA